MPRKSKPLRRDDLSAYEEMSDFPNPNEIREKKELRIDITPKNMISIKEKNKI